MKVPLRTRAFPLRSPHTQVSLYCLPTLTCAQSLWAVERGHCHWRGDCPLIGKGRLPAEGMRSQAYVCVYV